VVSDVMRTTGQRSAVLGTVNELTDGTVRSVDVAMRGGIGNPGSGGLVNEARKRSED
jgi:hypothetical protein